MKYGHAVQKLYRAGVDMYYLSPAVTSEFRNLESVVHELAHASTLSMCWTPTKSVTGRDDRRGLTNRIERKLKRVSRRRNDMNEEVSLAIESLVLAKLRIPFKLSMFIADVPWKGEGRDHVLAVRLARRRRSSKQRAARVARCIRLLQAVKSPR